MQPLPIFYDRRGNVVTPGADSVIKPRRGVFALVVAVPDQAILLIREPLAPDVPQLPGGGIEEGEDLDLALRREWEEETGIPFDVEGPFKTFHQIRGFQSAYGEFWIYDQTFRLYHFRGKGEPGKRWANGENGEASWEAISDLPDLCIHRGHWRGMVGLMPGLEQDQPTDKKASS